MIFGYYKNCLYTHRYKFSSEKKKKKEQIKSPRYMVSHPETGPDSLIGSDRKSGRDKKFKVNKTKRHLLLHWNKRKCAVGVDFIF